MHNIEIYAAENYPSCLRAKTLLDEHGLKYAEIDVTDDQTRLQLPRWLR